MRERGVLVLVVEASRMPQYAGFVSTVNGLLGTLQDQGGIARNLHERMYDLLERAFGDRIAVAQIDLTPRVSDNVLTTWALDAATRERLETIFKRRWCEERDSILGRWQYLKAGLPFEGEPIDRRRPPLD